MKHKLSCLVLIATLWTTTSLAQPLAPERYSLEALESISACLSLIQEEPQTNSLVKKLVKTSRGALTLLTDERKPLCLNNQTTDITPLISDTRKRLQRMWKLRNSGEASRPRLTKAANRLGMQLQVIQSQLCPQYAISKISNTSDGGSRVKEGASANSTVGIQVAATDQNAENAISYSLTTNPGNALQINATTGLITTTRKLYNEEGASIAFTAQASSTDGSTSSQEFSIAIVDDNLIPPAVLGALIDTNNAINLVVEGAEIGSDVGITLRAQDPNREDTVSYSLTNDSDGGFSIDETSGVVSVSGKIDFEPTPIATITALAKSSDGSESTLDVDVSVTNITTAMTLAFPPLFGTPGATVSARGTATGYDNSLEVKATGLGNTLSSTVNQNGLWLAPNLLSSQESKNAILTFQAEAHGEQSTPIVANFDTRTLPQSLALHYDTSEGAISFLNHPNGNYLAPLISRLNDVPGEVETLHTLPENLDPLTGLNDSAYDATTGTYYVLDYARGLFKVNNSTSELEEVSGLNVGSGAEIVAYTDGELTTYAISLTLDTAGQRAFVAVRPSRSLVSKIISINLVNGHRTQINDVSFLSPTNSTVSIRNAQSLVYAPSLDRLFVSDEGTSDYIHSISSTSESGFILSGFGSAGTIGTGPDFGGPLDLDFDAVNSRVIVTGSEGFEGVYAVDPISGSRTPIATATIGTGIRINSPYAIAVHPVTNNLVVGDNVNGLIVEINSTTGERTALVERGIGTGDHLDSAADLTASPDGSELFQLSNDRIIAIDKATGNRTVLVDFKLLSPAISTFSGSIAASADGQYIFLTSPISRAVYQINRNTSAVTTISSPTIGSGPIYNQPNLIFEDVGTAFVYVLDNAGRIYRIDTTTGSRTEALNFRSQGLRPFAYDDANNRFFLYNPATFHLAIGDITTGAITTIGNGTTGTGPAIQELISGFYDQAANTLLVTIPNNLIEIDLSTLTRTSRSSDTLGSGSSIGYYTRIAPGADRTIYAAQENVVSNVDLVSGDRVIISR
jgi:hypothetical protein